MASQELLLDICSIALFQLSTTALFISLSTVRKYLIRPNLLYLRWENPVEAAFSRPAGFGEGTEAEGAEAPSQAGANNALSEAHNEPIENTE